MATGVTETQEAISGAFTFVSEARRAAADGLSMDDVLAGMADGPMKEALRQAYDGASRIPDEIADLSLAEGASLAIYTLDKLREAVSNGPVSSEPGA